MLRLVNRRNLEVHVASKDLGRFAINGIHFGETGTVSTDGHIALEVPYPDELPDDLPEGIGDGGEPHGGGVTVPLSSLSMVVRALPKNSSRPILECAAVTKTEAGRVSFASTDLETVSRLEASPVDCEFPDASSVMDSSDVEREVVLGVEVLYKLVTALRKAKADNARIRFGFKSEGWHKDTDGVLRNIQSVIVSVPETGIRGAIMPVTVS